MTNSTGKIFCLIQELLRGKGWIQKELIKEGTISAKSKINGNYFWVQWTLREKCPNTEFFLVRIFLYSDWIRRFTELENRSFSNVFRGKRNWLFLKMARILYCSTAWKVSKYGVFSCTYFSLFGLNTEIYSVILRIQFKYSRIRTRKNSVFGHFSRSGTVKYPRHFEE